MHVAHTKISHNFNWIWLAHWFRKSIWKKICVFKNLKVKSPIQFVSKCQIWIAFLSLSILSALLLLSFHLNFWQYFLMGYIFNAQQSTKDAISAAQINSQQIWDKWSQLVTPKCSLSSKTNYHRHFVFAFYCLLKISLSGDILVKFFINISI